MLLYIGTPSRVSQVLGRFVSQPPACLLAARAGSVSRPLLVSLAACVVAIALAGTWYSTRYSTKQPIEEPKPASVDSGQKDRAQTDQRHAGSMDTNGLKGEENAGLWRAIQETVNIERVHTTGDLKREERALLRRDFNRIEELVRELKEQGLTSQALYASAQDRLAEASEQGALKLLEKYQRLDEQLARVDLDTMTTEEQFAYIYEARRYAFGNEIADMLFFEKEAYARYKLDEKAILQDATRSEQANQAEIVALRNALQVELAARGTYVSFADDRREDMETKLRERYGETLNALSAEQRRDAIWEMYREELPPEMVRKVEDVWEAQAKKRADSRKYRQEQEIIRNDPTLSSDDRQEKLNELSMRYESGRHASESLEE